MLRTLVNYMETKFPHLPPPILKPLTSDEWQAALSSRNVNNNSRPKKPSNVEIPRPSVEMQSYRQPKQHQQRRSSGRHNEVDHYPSHRFQSVNNDSEVVVGSPGPHPQPEGRPQVTTQLSYPQIMFQDNHNHNPAHRQNVPSANSGYSTSNHSQNPSFPPIPTSPVVTDFDRQPSRYSMNNGVRPSPRQSLQPTTSPRKSVDRVPIMRNTRTDSMLSLTKNRSTMGMERLRQPGERPEGHIEMTLMSQVLLGYSLSCGLHYLIYASLTEPGDDQPAEFRVAWTLKRLAPVFLMWFLSIEVIDTYKLDHAEPDNPNDLEQCKPLRHLVVSNWDNRTFYPFAILSCLLMSVYLDKPAAPCDARLAVAMGYVFIIGRLMYFCAVYLLMPQWRYFGLYVGNLHFFFYGHIYCFFRLCADD